MTTEASPRLIILGCGYVGRALAGQAVGQGWQVRALTRNADKAAALRQELEIEVVEGDLASGEWHDAFDPAGAWVVNCVSSGGGGVDGYRHSYLSGMESVLRWLRQRGPAEGLVYTGSTSVYPQSDGDWVDELSPTEPTTDLNAVLLQTEDLLRRAVEEKVLPRAAVLRLAGIYGPGRHYLIDQLRRGETRFGGPGDYFLNLIHRDDAAGALLRVVERWRGAGFELFNVADGVPALKEEIAAWTAAELGLPEPSFHLDEASLRMRRRLLAGGTVPNRRFASLKLMAATGWHPRYPSFRAGYRELLKN